MDLFFKNPKYFFDTYFAFSKKGILIAFLCFAIIIDFLCRNRFDKRAFKWIFIVLSSGYLAILIGITLLNTNRGVVAQPNFNPLYNIQEMFGENGVHQVRGCLSNVILFIPIGVFSSIYFVNHKFRYSLILAAIVSITIEVLQFVFQRGCAETMDVICNVLGALIASLITIRIIKTKDYINKRHGV